ncbi:MAG TPA: glycine--tRNA ligase subunit beta [Rudaea sp.]|jgi:glycyl-tRNA synthetase beta chain|uniref:glycine--tRNA ligase subunit beta n=1 Tax=Rudaea sp. TaxID=2136325 RepID=UPI002F94F015
MSTATRSLLIELGTEELPPKALDELAAAFSTGICDGLKKRGIEADIANAKAYCSPRRLAVLVPAVTETQPDQTQERRGPALNAGLDAGGQPTKALIGFAQSCGVEVAQLEKLETDKGAWFVHRAVKQGQPIVSLLPEIVVEALKTLPIPRPMRWGDHDFTFVRPVHWLVMLYGEELVNGEIFGLKSDRFSRGHRFHFPAPFDVISADLYEVKLIDRRVIPDPVDRRNKVASVVMHAVNELGFEFVEPIDLVAEVSNLLEWPVAIQCMFDKEFLTVPSEALVATMQGNQKFFPVFDANGKLTDHFIGVANIESKNPAEIRRGYERVIRPRFADAKFFYDEDLKTPLAAQQEALKSVTYQQSLGSVWDKCVRVAELARVIANRVGADAGLATRAAALSKCDLLTRMVGEFPELQGVMGRYYASANGENVEVAQALDEFYKPRFAGDGVATGTIGKVLAVAERLDTLAGIFAVGQKPSGNKDPFALRRAALGLARTLIEGDLQLDLKALLTEALQLLPDAALAAGLPKGKDGKSPALDAGARRDALAKELYDFILDRLRGYYADQGVAAEPFESVRALAPADLTDFDKRLRAVVEFSKLPQAQALAAANKRIGNILRQAGGDIGTKIDPALLDAGAETDLHRVVEATAKTIAPLAAQGSYVDTLRELASLREPVDRYFDAVMVMVDDTAKRANRLALLNRLRRMFLDVADISLLPGT